MSLPIDETLAVIRDYVTDSKVLQQITADLVAAEKEIKSAKEPAVKSKTRLVALIRGDAALKTAVAGGAFLVSVPDDDSTAAYSGDSLLSKIRAAVVAHNEQPAKRKSKKRVTIETWFQAFTTLKAKTLKGCGSQIGIKSKGQPCEVVVLEKETVAP